MSSKRSLRRRAFASLVALGEYLGHVKTESKFGTDPLGIWPVRTGIFGTNLSHPEGRTSAHFPRTPVGRM